MPQPARENAGDAGHCSSPLLLVVPEWPKEATGQTLCHPLPQREGCTRQAGRSGPNGPRRGGYPAQLFVDNKNNKNSNSNNTNLHNCSHSSIVPSHRLSRFRYKASNSLTFFASGVFEPNQNLQQNHWKMACNPFAGVVCSVFCYNCSEGLVTPPLAQVPESTCLAQGIPPANSVNTPFGRVTEFVGSALPTPPFLLP